jgi:hypothetical protein
VYRTEGVAAPVFRQVSEPGAKDLQGLVEQIALRIGRTLEQRGLIERDIENAWLAADAEAGPLDHLIGHSITYRVAMGPRAGQKPFTVQTLPARRPEEEDEEEGPSGAARAGGFSWHAGVAIAPGAHARLERSCRYVSRPPVASGALPCSRQACG